MELFSLRYTMSKKLLRTILIIIAIIALCVIAYCGWYLWQYWHGHELGDMLKHSWGGGDEDLSAKTVEIPVDFDSLHEVNPEIYAWIYIPGTDISYPVLQHDGDNGYYTRRAEDGNYFTGGCIYSENYNKKDFSDPMTVLYGHNLRSGKMFAQLNDFADVKVFDEHRYIYIYTPEKMLVYEIFAAYPFSHKHLLLNFDFNDSEQFEAFFDDVMYKPGLSSNFMDNVELDGTKDKILTLSTCLRGDNQQRYLVQGRLISEIPAKK